MTWYKTIGHQMPPTTDYKYSSNVIDVPVLHLVLVLLEAHVVLCLLWFHYIHPDQEDQDLQQALDDPEQTNISANRPTNQRSWQAGGGGASYRDSIYTWKTRNTTTSLETTEKKQSLKKTRLRSDTMWPISGLWLVKLMSAYSGRLSWKHVSC